MAWMDQTRSTGQVACKLDTLQHTGCTVGHCSVNQSDLICFSSQHKCLVSRYSHQPSTISQQQILKLYSK